MATTPVKSPTTDTAYEEDPASEIETLLSKPIRVMSPSLAPRKTRILSSTSQRQPLLTSPLKSPIRVSVVRSPSAGKSYRSSLCTESCTTVRDSPEFSQISLRRYKQRARNPQHISTLQNTDSNPLPVLVDLPPIVEAPPSIRHLQRWKPGAHSQGVASSSRLQCAIDKESLPVLIPSVSSNRFTHGYVTRSWFHENCSQKDPESLSTSNSRCFPSVVASDAGAAEPQVKSYVTGVQSDGIVSRPGELLGETILSQNFETDSELEWDADEEVQPVSGSDESDWETYAPEICQEDLPRLGVVQIDQDFDSRPMENGKRILG
ncbi:hypothetical protein R1sor_000266 [Riccia sorocarpa]|uniref:Uncharacterized protein n=1 Tax=Riccia sorocarpa TaxID=122646 RepID=A0ABD3GV37_9MARC